MDRCEHHNDAARCCECLTAKFRVWEAQKAEQRRQAQAVRASIRTYRSTALGMVTIPE